MRGRVVRVVGVDSVPLVRAWAVLHRVSATGGAPVDSQVTDRRGAYRLVDQAPDSSATYIVSVRHDGIAYFSVPLHQPAGGSDTLPPLMVYDTASAGAPIVLAERHVVVRSSDGERGRRVIELLVLRNGGTTTRVSADSAHPVWRGAIPDVAEAFEVGASDVSEQAVRRRGDVVEVFAPVPPGERQLVMSYFVPSSLATLGVPVDPAAEFLAVLLEDPGASAEGAGLAFRGREELESLAFLRYQADSVPAGEMVTVRLPVSGRGIPMLLWVVVPLAALALAGGLISWWRRSGLTHAPAPAGDDPVQLAREIAALDARYQAQPEDAAYRAQRAELKQRLERALAERGQAR